MERSEFLKIVGASPFAFKALLMDHGKEHIEAYSEDIQTIEAINQKGLSIKKGNELISLSTDFSITTQGDIDFMNGPYFKLPRRPAECTVNFNSVRMPRKEYNMLHQVFENDELVNAEIYNPRTSEFISFNARLIEIERTGLPASNQINGCLLVMGPIDITVVA